MNDDLKERERQRDEELKDRFELILTILRHDMKNKLQIVTGYLQLLEDTDLSDENLKLVDKTLNACKVAQELIGKVGIFKDILKAGEPQPEKLSHHIRNAVKRYEDEAGQKGISMECDLQNVDVYGYPFLDELFAHLIENSIRHSQCSQLRLSVDENDDDVEVIVEDDGKGIPKDSWKDIFDGGYRGMGSTGSGLGLYTVKTIAEKCGGEVMVDKSSLGGARFKITFDRA